MTDEKLLFAVHVGSVGSRLAGIIMQNHCLPIACSHPSWRKNGKDGPTSEAGLHALWEATADVEQFFGGFGQTGGIGEKYYYRYTMTDEGPGGLWVYEVSYHDHEVTDIRWSDGEWSWLCGGELRRPTVEEMEPLTRGEAPWAGVTL